MKSGAQRSLQKIKEAWISGLLIARKRAPRGASSMDQLLTAHPMNQRPQPSRLPIPAWLRDIFASQVDTLRLPARFADAQSERDFLADFGRRFAPMRRTACVLGFLVWTIFLWWDIYHYRTDPDSYTLQVMYRVLTLRLVGMLALAALAALSLGERFADDRYAHVVLSMVALLAALLLIAMIAIVPPPIDYIYYFVGVYLVLIFQFGFFHLRARPVLINTLLITTCIVVMQYGRTFGLPITLLQPVYFHPAVVYYVSICVIGFSLCVKFERFARQQYDHERRLAREQAINLHSAKALLQAKEQQRGMAVQASQDKSRFLASAVHDLRQPMFGLGLSLQALQHALAARDWEESARLLAMSQRLSKTMAASFNAVLDLSKLDCGLVQAQPSHFDLIDLLREVGAGMQDFASSRGTRIRMRAPAAPLMVRSDRAMLSRIITNLVSNGIKYRDTRRGERCAVLIGVVRRAASVRIDIVDNGLGIPPSERTRIFQPFFQLDNPERDREQGLGLGLSIVQASLALLARHTLEFRSTPGRGTRFSLVVPRSSAAGRGAAPLQPAGQTASSLAGVHVLLVEDDSLVRAAMAAMLRHWGMLVDAAADLPALAHTLSELERYPDLVVTDYSLPGNATAAEAVALVRRSLAANGCPRRVPVLLITGEADSVALARRAGATAVLAKPAPPDELRAAICALLARPPEPP